MLNGHQKLGKKLQDVLEEGGGGGDYQWRKLCIISVSPKGGYQGAPPHFLVWFSLMWSLECLIYFDLMEKL